MKKTIIFACLLLSAVLTAAQDKSSLFGYGISSDFLSVPLSEHSLATQSTNVFFTYILKKDLSFKIGFDGLLLKDSDAKRYENLSCLMLSAGYTILKDQQRNFTTELTLSASNGFDDFSTFRNYHADLGIRVMMLKSFFIGSGLRFAHSEEAGIIAVPQNSYNWYMQMGIQLYLHKR